MPEGKKREEKRPKGEEKEWVVVDWDSIGGEISDLV